MACRDVLLDDGAGILCLRQGESDDSPAARHAIAFISGALACLLAVVVVWCGVRWYIWCRTASQARRAVRNAIAEFETPPRPIASPRFVEIRQRDAVVVCNPGEDATVVLGLVGGDDGDGTSGRDNPTPRTRVFSGPGRACSNV
jgi:hypothetical protein